MEAIIITDWATDYSQHLFVNGELALTGDYYHDKIDAMIEGYILGIESLGHSVNVRSLAVDSDKVRRAIYTEDDGREVLIHSLEDEPSILLLANVHDSFALSIHSPEEIEDAITMGVLSPID